MRDFSKIEAGWNTCCPLYSIVCDNEKDGLELIGVFGRDCFFKGLVGGQQRDFAKGQ